MDFQVIKECFKYFSIGFALFVFLLWLFSIIITIFYHFKLISILKSKRKQNLPMSYYVDEFEIGDNFVIFLGDSYYINHDAKSCNCLVDKDFYNKYLRKAGFSQSQIAEFNSLFDKKYME
ncbi:hypothetical protein [Candidatus Phytoplasma pini]|uniref:Uncharacterized protein n=1 Tax=Candidatus Phytoplasma pini TaxID=267362 RepID=A0A559KIY3_9MOLU|nr:hypothetical protein [Candidatus Phytoplasma pini]TVY12090.1 hypothetical protein MDPP_00377 [Candidatus Phytoplasma pini]